MDPWGLSCDCEDFTVTFRGWTGWWGGRIWPWYTKQADVMFRLVLAEGSRREDCIITQYRRGETFYNGGIQADFSGGWGKDAPLGSLGWWDGSSWHAGLGEWNGNVAIFYDSPGFFRLDESAFPIRMGGEGGEGSFLFSTRVIDRESGNIVAEQNWGILIDYSSPDSGSFSFTLSF